MDGKLLPVVYCLTVRKDLPTYSRIFEALHSKANLLLKLAGRLIYKKYCLLIKLKFDRQSSCNHRAKF
ncbi:hypothetical protein T10_26 [Trichinella papuae]|uniref:Uncharacterized protein n=1 Tax=Trichinella papuae TaxID=268474 RepID=A0A0V1MYK4_9BILA|nr:hypothetical protein T10_26 [Trichinella papuae]